MAAALTQHQNSVVDAAASKAQTDAWNDRQVTLDSDRDAAVAGALDAERTQAQVDAWNDRQVNLDSDRDAAVAAELDAERTQAQLDAWDNRQLTLMLTEMQLQQTPLMLNTQAQCA